MDITRLLLKSYFFEFREIIVLRSNDEFHQFARMKEANHLSVAHSQEAVFERIEFSLDRRLEFVFDKQFHVLLS